MEPDRFFPSGYPALFLVEQKLLYTSWGDLLCFLILIAEHQSYDKVDLFTAQQAAPCLCPTSEEHEALEMSESCTGPVQHC